MQRGKMGPRATAKSAARPQRAQATAPPARRRRRGQRRRGNGGTRASTKVGGSYLCPDSFQRTLVPLSLKTTPHTLINERKIISITTDPAEDKLILLGSVASLSADQRTSVIGAVGSSGSLTTALTPQVSVKLPATTYGAKCRLRLHRLSVTVACDGNTIGAVPSGHVFYGTLPNALDMTGFTDVAGIITYLETVNQVHGSTAQRCSIKPARLVSYPLDKLEWQQFSILNSTNPANPTRFDDTLAPIAIVIKRVPVPGGVLPSDGSNKWTISVHMEWGVMFSNDPILQATHRLHPSTSSGLWDQAIMAAQNTGGLIESVSRGVGQAEELVAGGLGLARRLGL